MNESERKKRTRRKNGVPESKGDDGRDKATDQKQSDSDDVERAVYDGMQDLRVKKPG